MHELSLADITNMILLDKVHFYKFLNGDTSILDFEKQIYSNRNWERQLGEDLYFELINFDFKDKNSTIRIREFILNNIVEVGEFETWKLKTILTEFLSDVLNMPGYLDKFYDLYCGTYQENGIRKFRYKFLGNLGLNCFFWKDEDYLKYYYGENWKFENERISDDLEFYHKQLKPFGEVILDALNKRDIQIDNDGTYTIADKLRDSLESEKIIVLEHPERKNVS